MLVLIAAAALAFIKGYCLSRLLTILFELWESES